MKNRTVLSKLEKDVEQLTSRYDAVIVDQAQDYREKWWVVEGLPECRKNFRTNEVP